MATEKAQEVFAAGIEAQEAGDSDKALRLYEQASALDSTAPHIKLRLAYLLYNQGKSKDAIRVARQILKGWPRVRLAHCAIGRSYDELGRLVMAERFYRQSLAIKQCAVTWVFLASLLDVQIDPGKSSPTTILANTWLIGIKKKKA